MSFPLVLDYDARTASPARLSLNAPRGSMRLLRRFSLTLSFVLICLTQGGCGTHSASGTSERSAEMYRAALRESAQRSDSIAVYSVLVEYLVRREPAAASVERRLWQLLADSGVVVIKAYGAMVRDPTINPDLLMAVLLRGGISGR